MICRFNINTVEFIRALHALRRMVEYSAYFGCSTAEADSLVVFLDQMERNYHDFLHRNDVSQSGTITRDSFAGRAEAREQHPDGCCLSVDALAMEISKALKALLIDPYKD